MKIKGEAENEMECENGRRCVRSVEVSHISLRGAKADLALGKGKVELHRGKCFEVLCRNDFDLSAINCRSLHNENEYREITRKGELKRLGQRVAM